MDFNGDLNLATLQPAPVFPELYQELWWASGTYAEQNPTIAGSYFVVKGASGSSGAVSGSSSSATHLYTHSSSWPASAKFSFECALYTSNSSGAAYAELWDITSNTAVTGSQVSTTATTFTVLRSGQFTLTAGHVYGVTIWIQSGTTYIPYITDMSIISFPSSPLTSPSVSGISLANPSGNTLKEAYIPLWVYSPGNVSNSNALNWVQKGSTAIATSATSATTLFTLNSSWKSNQKFALESSLWTGNASYSANVYLYDNTSAGYVTGASVNTYSTTATLVRSSSFTLTPGHSYAIVMGPSTTGYPAYMTKAHLVALSS